MLRFGEDPQFCRHPAGMITTMPEEVWSRAEKAGLTSNPDGYAGRTVQPWCRRCGVTLSASEARHIQMRRRARNCLLGVIGFLVVTALVSVCTISLADISYDFLDLWIGTTVMLGIIAVLAAAGASYHPD